MSRDYGEVEREFIDGLESDTGRDLARWMALIDGQDFAHRNDMIDWLRQQGLTFAKASRLERIHNNGGKPLYAEKPVPKVAEIQPAVAAPGPDAVPRTSAPPLPEPTSTLIAAAATPAVGSVFSADPIALSAFLARAKGYRPLAELLLRFIRGILPATVTTLHETHLELGAPRPYAALVVSAKDVRLALDLGDRPIEGDLKRLRLPGVAANLTHTLVISDARRVDAGLKALLLAAAGRVNS